jgi:chromate transporter
MLRDLCVDRHRWIDAEEFEDAIAACNMLPGPASTQLAIYCASRVAGRRGALIGGAAFILPGLAVILGLSALFLGNPPTWVRALGAGAGSAVAAVAIHATFGLVPASWERASSRRRWVLYVVTAALVAVQIGPWVVLALIGCGVCELLVRRPPRHLRVREATDRTYAHLLAPAMFLWGGVTGVGSAASLAWTAFKVGALSYGGGFVIIPLMRSDAVDLHHWMSNGDFLNAVALGQITPGPIVLTVAAVGYAAAGLGGGLFAALVAFSPSFAFILVGAQRFDSLRSNLRVRAFLEGSGPAAIGAIVGTAWLLGSSLSEVWQLVVLAGASAMLLAWHRGVVLTLIAAATAGLILVGVGAPLP